MQNFEYSAQSQHSFQTATQTISNMSNNFVVGPQDDQRHRFFDQVGYMQRFTPYNPSLSDPTSLPPAGFPHVVQDQRNTAKPHPPALRTTNLTVCNERTPESPYSVYQQAYESPCTQLQTPMTPAEPSLYSTGSGADSMTSFSPSSNTSGELDPAEESSPSVDYAALENMGQTETRNDGTKPSGDNAERKKRNSRRMWTHSLEKYIFTPHEIATLGTPHRRTIYSASLEAHIDRLHSQLLGIDLYPVHFDDLQVYRGLNCKIAKSMVAGLQHDFVQVRTRLLEIERAMANAREMAAMRANHDQIEMQHQNKVDTFRNGQMGNQLVDPSSATAAGPVLSTSEHE